MRRFLPLLFVFVLACNTFVPTPPPSSTPRPTLSPRPVATFTHAPTLTATPLAARRLRPEDIVLHPETPLYTGDVVSFEVLAPDTDRVWNNAEVKIYREGEDAPFAKGHFDEFGIGGRAQASFWWVWDTDQLTGPQTLRFEVTADESQTDAPPLLGYLTLEVPLLPKADQPEPEADARWTHTESACCVFYYLTHTAAERDIETIKTMADTSFEKVETRLGVESKQKVVFNLLSRLLGHGGFASSEIYITYMDRDPAGTDLNTVFTHEGSHILDRYLSTDRPSMLTEGLAVYVAGGHYQVEDLDARAASLFVLDSYIPLADLARDFYHAQHEIGYLEAGAFIQYLVETYGLEKFKQFYAAFRPGPDDHARLNAALETIYQQSLADLETEWNAHLKTVRPTEDQIEHLRLTVELFDTLRLYQQNYVPSAHFLTAWLPDGPEARKRGIVADFIRSPNSADHIALEAMLVAAGDALDANEIENAEQLLDALNTAIQAHSLMTDPLAREYLHLVQAAAAQQYEAQTITIEGNHARVTAIREWPTVESLTFNQTANGWRLAR